MTVYRTTGVLTGTIEQENVGLAQEYLHEDDMVKYVGANADLEGVLVWIQWDLHADGHNYHITAITTRDLTDEEQARLSSEVSGQNSDGLGESFEQQAFAWDESEQDEETCGSCNGAGYLPEQDDDGEDLECGECDGSGYLELDRDGRMISFDWESNKLEWVKVS